MSWIFGAEKKDKIRATSSVGITESGKREASRYSDSGDHFVLLSELEDRSPQNVANLAKEAHVSINDAIRMLEVLKNQRYIQVVGN